MDVTRLFNLAISETGFIFDPVTGNSYMTNQTGIHIIGQLKKGESISSIAQHLSNEYNVSDELAEQDILQLIEILRSYYLI